MISRGLGVSEDPCCILFTWVLHNKPVDAVGSSDMGEQGMWCKDNFVFMFNTASGVAKLISWLFSWSSELLRNCMNVIWVKYFFEVSVTWNTYIILDHILATKENEAFISVNNQAPKSSTLKILPGTWITIVPPLMRNGLDRFLNTFREPEKLHCLQHLEFPL